MWGCEIGFFWPLIRPSVLWAHYCTQSQQNWVWIALLFPQNHSRALPQVMPRHVETHTQSHLYICTCMQSDVDSISTLFRHFKGVWIWWFPGISAMQKCVCMRDIKGRLLMPLWVPHKKGTHTHKWLHMSKSAYLWMFPNLWTIWIYVIWCVQVFNSYIYTAEPCMWSSGTNYSKNLNKWVEKNNRCICFHTDHEGSLKGLMSMKMMWIISM